MDTRWPLDRARDWHTRAGWAVGCNYIPAYATNQLEHWNPDTFDLPAIDRELGWAADLGFNSIRVFLHDLCWTGGDPAGFLDRIDRFAGVAARHRISVMWVLFDSVWHPFPRLGPQRPPEPHVHNAGWVQSPGASVLADPARFAALQPYVDGVIRHFADDARVLAWDLWNEPDNPNTASYGPRDLPNKSAAVLPQLDQTFTWARDARPTQPLTSGVWLGDFEGPGASAVTRLQLERSDVISFHSYSNPASATRAVDTLAQLGRPLLCTEFMARPTGSTFDAILPVLRDRGVGAYCWGLVDGKTQTKYPWDSWTRTYSAEPSPWFHDILRPDGTPYDAAETARLRAIIAAGATGG